MKVAIFSESSADESAIRILVDAIIGERSIAADLPGLRARGWSSVLANLPLVYRAVYYGSDANALVVVIDSNGSPIHDPSRNSSGTCHPDCRFCLLDEAGRRVRSGLKPVPARPPLCFAIGVAVPAIEAWLASLENPKISETTWRQIMAEQSTRYDKKSLKVDLYGTDTPGIEAETEIMVMHAKALATNISILEQRFPNGFAPLVQALRQ